jgi:AraC family transcriptional regulator, transcriptional activator of pobA
MKRSHLVETIREYNIGAGQETLHPLVSVINFANFQGTVSRTVDFIRFGFYAVFLKQDEHCEILYGRKKYDYQEGTLVFIAPGQEVSIEADDLDYTPKGQALLFHPDLLHNTALGRKIYDCTFFSYAVHEALHLSEREEKLVQECFEKIRVELQQPVDKHSKHLIVSNIELFLDYCRRFYDRQFLTREHEHSSLLNRFEALLTTYFKTGRAQEEGLPTVAQFAAKLNLSANYFGDLIRKASGKTAQEYIQLRLLQEAKQLIHDPCRSISQVAHELGFKYPQHFSRFFKQQVGMTPLEFRSKEHL